MVVISSTALACNGGGPGVLFNGTLIYEDFFVLNGGTGAPQQIGGVINIDEPWIDGTLVEGMDTVWIRDAILTTHALPVTVRYIDIKAADIVPTADSIIEYYCDESIGGYYVYISEAYINVCTETICP